MRTIKTSKQQSSIENIDYKKIERLILKNNKKITDFGFLKNMNNLKELDLSNTLFSDLSLFNPGSENKVYRFSTLCSSFAK